MSSTSSAALDRGRKLAFASSLKDLTLLLLDELERELAEVRAENAGLRAALRQQQEQHQVQLQLEDYRVPSKDRQLWQLQGLDQQRLRTCSAQKTTRPTSRQTWMFEESRPWTTNDGDGDGGAGRGVHDSFAPLESGLKAAGDAAAGAPVAPCARPPVRHHTTTDINNHWLQLPGELASNEEVRGPSEIGDPPRPHTASCMLLKFEKTTSSGGFADIRFRTSVKAEPDEEVKAKAALKAGTADDWEMSDVDSSDGFHDQVGNLLFDPTGYSPTGCQLLKKGLMTNVFSDCFHCWVKETRRVQLLKEPIRFSFKPVWANGDNTGGIMQPGMLATTTQNFFAEADHEKQTTYDSVFELDDADEVVKDASCGVLSPSGGPRIAWDVFGAILLCFDIILIPLSSFDIGRNWFTKGFDWTTLAFWTFDMVMSMSTGFVHQGVTEMRRYMILLNYIRGWMWLDLVVVGPDWVFTILDMANQSEGVDGSSANTSRLLRTLRILRLARLLRLVKLRRIFAMIRDRIDSEFMFIIANIIQLIIMLLVVNHFLASIWYAIGDFSRAGGGDNWIEDSKFHLDTVTVGYKYTTSLHWSLTQFTPASMAVQPTNTLERTFAIAVLVSGFVLFSSFVSSITASMTQLRSMQDKVSQQIWLLRRYLRQRGIQPELAFRILRYVEWKCGEQRDLVSESRVQVLGILSEQLRSELQYSVSFSCLMGHPLFEQISHASNVLIHRLAANACSQKSLATKDVLISPGIEATHMYMVVSGELAYRKIDEADFGTIENKMQKDDWLCEQALWTRWHHIGTVEALNESKLVGIDASVFEKVLVPDRRCLELASAYCSGFMDWLTRVPRKDLTDAFLASEMREVVRGFMECEVPMLGKASRRTSVRQKGSSGNVLLRSATRSLRRL